MPSAIADAACTTAQTHLLSDRAWSLLSAAVHQVERRQRLLGQNLALPKNSPPDGTF
jgi:hypothetical protein